MRKGDYLKHKQDRIALELLNGTNKGDTYCLVNRMDTKKVDPIVVKIKDTTPCVFLGTVCIAEEKLRQIEKQYVDLISYQENAQWAKVLMRWIKNEYTLPGCIKFYCRPKRYTIGVIVKDVYTTRDHRIWIRFQ